MSIFYQSYHEDSIFFLQYYSTENLLYNDTFLSFFPSTIFLQKNINYVNIL